MVRILPLLCLALLAGCKTADEPASEKAPIGEGHWYDPIVDHNPLVSHIERVPTPYPPMSIEDLPAPVGFEIVPRESFAYVHGSMRVAKLRYRGLGPKEDIEAFYHATMPNYGWKETFDLGHDKPDLLFQKGDEASEVVIRDEGKYREITITLAPK